MSLHDSQAAPVDGNAAAYLQVPRRPRVVDADAATTRFDHLRDGANDPGEHRHIP